MPGAHLPCKYSVITFCVPPYSLKLLTPPQKRTFVEISGGDTDPDPQTMGPVSYSSETYDLVSWAWLCLITGLGGRAGVGLKARFLAIRLLTLLLAEAELKPFLMPA